MEADFGHSQDKRKTRDGRESARYYQSFLDSPEVTTRAELARFLGVCGAQVAQVMRRLDSASG